MEKETVRKRNLLLFSGAIFEETFGLPNIGGRCLIVLASMLTVLLGLNRIVNILSFIGPVIIGFMVLTGAASCALAVLALAGLILSGLLTFAEIISLLYSTVFWLGLVFLCFVAASRIRRREFINIR